MTPPAADPGGVVFRQLGHLTRQLHDALCELGLMPGLQHAAAGLPDARSRLHYIAERSGRAAERVLNAVDLAKLEQGALRDALRALAARGAGDGDGDSAGTTAGTTAPAADAADTAVDVAGLLARAEAGLARVDAQLTEIMLAQDFHDLTGQVIARVVGLAGQLEGSLLQVLMQAAPAPPAAPAAPASGGPILAGPAIDASPRADVARNQREVDDLLASLGF